MRSPWIRRLGGLAQRAAYRLRGAAAGLAATFAVIWLAWSLLAAPEEAPWSAAATRSADPASAPPAPTPAGSDTSAFGSAPGRRLRPVVTAW
jgi:hypothetical protein